MVRKDEAIIAGVVAVALVALAAIIIMDPFSTEEEEEYADAVCWYNYKEYWFCFKEGLVLAEDGWSYIWINYDLTNYSVSNGILHTPYNLTLNIDGQKHIVDVDASHNYYGYSETFVVREGKTMESGVVFYVPTPSEDSEIKLEWTNPSMNVRMIHDTGMYV